MVTATVLYNMTEDDLARGFKELASRTAKRVALELERDLGRARFGEERSQRDSIQGLTG